MTLQTTKEEEKEGGVEGDTNNAGRIQNKVSGTKT